MKKAISGIFIMALLFASSCSKNTSGTASNSWSFKSVNYTASTCIGTGNTLTATFLSGTNPGTLSVTFYGSLLPITGGTDTVSPGLILNAANHVLVQASVGSTYYNSTAGNGNETVSVSVASNGKLTISGSGIVLANTLSQADSSTVSFSMTQQ